MTGAVPPEMAHAGADTGADEGWPRTVEEAYAVQDRLRPLVDPTDHGQTAPRTVAGLDTACARVLALAPRYRLPETTRQADRRCRGALAAAAATP